MKALKWKVILIIVGVIFGSVLFVVPFSRAYVELKDFEEFKNDETFKFYIYGVGVGFSWANGELKHIGQSPLYCQPDNLRLGRENYLEILQRYIEKHKNTLKPHWDVEFLLLLGLEETFPCNK